MVVIRIRQVMSFYETKNVIRGKLTLLIGSFQHSTNLEDIRLRAISTECVSCAIKTQDNLAS
jgi:hypothetical protein